MPNRFVDEDPDWLVEVEQEKSDMPFTKKEQISIKLKAQRALGQMNKADDKRIFMRNCIDQMTSDDPEVDDSDARDVCEQLWEEGDTSEYE